MIPTHKRIGYGAVVLVAVMCIAVVAIHGISGTKAVRGKTTPDSQGHHTSKTVSTSSSQTPTQTTKTTTATKTKTATHTETVTSTSTTATVKKPSGPASPLNQASTKKLLTEVKDFFTAYYFIRPNGNDAAHLAYLEKTSRQQGFYMSPSLPSTLQLGLDETSGNTAIAMLNQTRRLDKLTLRGQPSVLEQAIHKISGSLISIKVPVVLMAYFPDGKQMPDLVKEAQTTSTWQYSNGLWTILKLYAPQLGLSQGNE